MKKWVWILIIIMFLDFTVTSEQDMPETSMIFSGDISYSSYKWIAFTKKYNPETTQEFTVEILENMKDQEITVNETSKYFRFMIDGVENQYLVEVMDYRGMNFTIDQDPSEIFPVHPLILFFNDWPWVNFLVQPITRIFDNGSEINNFEYLVNLINSLEDVTRTQYETMYLVTSFEASISNDEFLGIYEFNNKNTKITQEIRYNITTGLLNMFDGVIAGANPDSPSYNDPIFKQHIVRSGYSDLAKKSNELNIVLNPMYFGFPIFVIYIIYRKKKKLP
ncbi:MAG: hypothetical protein ACXAAT_17280 [Candidatus Hodarchaeales archaeon]